MILPPDTSVLMLGGPDDGKLITPRAPLHHGARLETFCDRPMSLPTAVAFMDGDWDAASRHAKLDKFIYRVVEWRCGELHAFVGIDDARSDEDSLALLLNGYRGQP